MVSGTAGGFFASSLEDALVGVMGIDYGKTYWVKGGTMCGCHDELPNVNGVVLKIDVQS
jgi:hypothetical protein